MMLAIVFAAAMNIDNAVCYRGEECLTGPLSCVGEADCRAKGVPMLQTQFSPSCKRGVLVRMESGALMCALKLEAPEGLP